MHAVSASPRGDIAAVPRIIVLEGNPVQIGLRHGHALGERIHFLVSQLESMVFQRVGRVRSTGLRVVAHTLARVMERQIPQPLRLEMRAIAEGSGARYSDILLLNSLDDILNILRRLAPRTPSLGCSSFALFGPASQDGRLLHGRNLDYHFRGTPLDDGGRVARLLQEQATLFVYRPEDRASFVSVAWPGVCGVTTALNQEGISIANLTSYLRGTTPNGTPSSILYRLVAEEVSSIGEARQILRAARCTIGNNLIVGSGRENRAALFEITADTVAEVTPRGGALVATNHFVSSPLVERQRPFLPSHSVARRERLEELSQRRGTTLEEALGYLADTGPASAEPAGNAFARVANEGTAVSVLFQPSEMAMWMGISQEPPASGDLFWPVDAGALLSGIGDERAPRRRDGRAA